LDFFFKVQAKLAHKFDQAPIVTNKLLEL